MTFQISVVDPFDLPEWLGSDEVTWIPNSGIRAGALIEGELEGAGPTLDCDLLAVDQAYPRAVVDENTRVSAHQAWQHGQVHLVDREARLTLAVPGRDFTPQRVMEAIERFARAVGAAESRFSVLLRLGD